MSQVEFQYNGNKTIIQCNENEKIKEIYKKFTTKTQIEQKNIYFLYDGKTDNDINEELTFIEMANSIDKERKKMIILVNNINEMENEKILNKSIIKSKNIICPECGENIKIKINDYKISLYNCKNGHKINDLLLKDYENTQKINLSTIICNECNTNNKYNTYKNEFYKCYDCKINLCPLCKLKHNKNHNIINYDKINYICEKHNEIFTKYCNNCKINICSICETEHLGHDGIYLGSIILKKEELEKKLNELRKYIDSFNEDINRIIQIINNVKEIFEKYYEIEKDMINNYDIRNRNYEILFNLNEIIENNINITKDINKIINENQVKNKFNKILNIYNKLNNEIRLTVKIEKEDINKKIYFLDNSNNDNIYINGKEEEHYHDLLKEINESNTQLFINDKKYKYKKFFIPEKEGIYLIKLKLNISITDCSGMFYNCTNLEYIDLSCFDSKKVNNMTSMFFGCSNLVNIDFSSFNTENVTNMDWMFSDCKNLKNVDLSSFNTKNVINMDGLFYGCNNLINIDLSSFDTKRVISMFNIFSGCNNLINIELSYFDIENTTNIFDMFFNCNNIKQIKINKKSYEKIKNEIKSKNILLILI